MVLHSAERLTRRKANGEEHIYAIQSFGLSSPTRGLGRLGTSASAERFSIHDGSKSGNIQPEQQQLDGNDERPECGDNAVQQRSKQLDCGNALGHSYWHCNFAEYSGSKQPAEPEFSLDADSHAGISGSVKPELDQWQLGLELGDNTVERSGSIRSRQ